MKKYRFLEFNNGRVIVQRRIFFFFWTSAYTSYLFDTPTEFTSLGEAKLKLERDLKEKNREKYNRTIKAIHD